MQLSVVMITRNAAGVVADALKSVEGLWDELIVSDQNSTDGTQEILEQYKASIVTSQSENLGKRKQDLIKKANGDWILVLDSDERVSPELKQEIQTVLRQKSRDAVVGYRIPYQNYIFGKLVRYGGERYSKIRLFKRGHGFITPLPIHEEVVVDGSVGELSGAIRHYSFRTAFQLFGKFTHYARIAAQALEIASPKTARNDMGRKLFLYGPHMVWARYVEEKGYRDGWRGLVLALAFGYMEALTYWLLLFL